MKRTSERLGLFILSGILLISNLLLGNLWRVWQETIMYNLENSIRNSDSGLLLMVTAQIVAYNSSLMYTFIVGGLLLLYLFRNRFSPYILWGLMTAFIFLMHLFVFHELGNYPLMTLLLLILITIGLLILRIGFGETGIEAILLIPALVVLAFNSLAIMPTINDYNLNSNDLIWNAILAGRFLNAQGFINTMGITFFIIILLLAIIAAELFRLYRRRLIDLEALRKIELQNQQTQYKAHEYRVLQEMNTLVHDLKTPLVTVQGLNSLLQMAITDKQLLSYTNRIEGAVDNLNKMISEILYDDVRKEITVQDLIKYIRAHVEIKTSNQKLNFEVSDNLPLVQVNLIRIARALINLIENASTAILGIPYGSVTIKVEKEQQDLVSFSIIDNGAGIPEESLPDIWTPGYSTKTASSGLGLAFVKRVIENHHGTITIKSKPGMGTVVKVVIPGVNKDDKDIDN